MKSILFIVDNSIRLGWQLLDFVHDIAGWGLLFVTLLVTAAYFFEAPSSEWFKSEDA